MLPTFLNLHKSSEAVYQSHGTLVQSMYQTDVSYMKSIYLVI